MLSHLPSTHKQAAYDTLKKSDTKIGTPLVTPDFETNNRSRETQLKSKSKCYLKNNKFNNKSKTPKPKT